MKRNPVAWIALLSLGWLNTGRAADQAEDEAAIRKTVESYTDAFNKRDPKAMAALRITTEGAGCGRCFLAALRSGAAMPMTVAITISQVRYSATSQVQASRCASAHRARSAFIASSSPL